MIIDCFPYFNEKELLELRLRLLYGVVDRFIITEGSHTHKGIPKEFTCEETIRNCGIPLDKITIVKVDMPDAVAEPDAWVRERMQRNAAANYIGPDDVAFVSDCDEIIDPIKVKYYAAVAKSNPQYIIRLPLDYLCGSAKWRLHQPSGQGTIGWTAPFICLQTHLQKYTLSDIREDVAWNRNNLDFENQFITENNVVESAGWHFCWMGGKTRIAEKQNYFLHDDVYTANPDAVLHEGSYDVLGRSDHVVAAYDITQLPPMVFQLPHIKSFLQL